MSNCCCNFGFSLTMSRSPLIADRIAIRKYAASGSPPSLQWAVNRSDNILGISVPALGVAVLSDGTVVSVGDSDGFTGGTRKNVQAHSSAGAFLWEISLATGVRARAVAVNHSAGIIYVGSDSTSGQDTLHKLNSSGTVLDSIDTGLDIYAIAIDESTGDIYVTGESDGTSSTWKYDSDLNEQWDANGASTGLSIAIHPVDGYVYQGQVGNSANAFPFIGVIDPDDGTVVDAYVAGPTNFFSAQALGLAFDSSGNLYVAGFLGNGSGNPGTHIRAFDSSDQSVLWNYNAGNFSTYTSIALSGSKIIATNNRADGSVSHAGFDTSGNLEWSLDHGDGGNCCAFGPSGEQVFGFDEIVAP